MEWKTRDTQSRKTSAFHNFSRALLLVYRFDRALMSVIIPTLVISTFAKSLQDKSEDSPNDYYS